MRRIMPHRSGRTAFTLVDTLMTVAVLGIVAGLSLSSMAPTDRTRVLSAATLFASDIEHARALSLIAPDNPAVVRSAADGASYWIARNGSTETEIPPAAGRKFRVAFGQSPAEGLKGVSVRLVSGGAVPANGGGIIILDGFGRLAGASVDAVFELKSGSEVSKVRVLFDTGDVYIQ